MKLIVLLLSGLLAYPQFPLGAWPMLRGDIQEAHVLPMMIYFSSDHCQECDKFDALFEQPEMLQRMEQHYVSVRVSIDDTNGKACADIYRIETVPAFVIADQKGMILYKSDESLSVEDIQLLLENAPAKYSTLNRSLENIAEDNGSTYDINQLSGNQSAETLSTLPVEERTYDHQSAETISDVNIEESKPVHVIPVSTTIEEIPPAIQKTPAMNVSPSSIEAEIKSEDGEMSIVANTKPAVTNSSTSTAVGTKPVASKPLVRVQRSYSIQLAFFTEAINSNKFVERAKAKGLTETRTQTEMRDGKSCYRVLIGDFITLADAQAQLAEVHSLGFKGAVHRQ